MKRLECKGIAARGFSLVARFPATANSLCNEGDDQDQLAAAYGL